MEEQASPPWSGALKSELLPVYCSMSIRSCQACDFNWRGTSKKILLCTPYLFANNVGVGVHVNCHQSSAGRQVYGEWFTIPPKK
jgi:hypothetical protein